MLRRRAGAAAAAGLAAGVVVDCAFGDPARFHPVAGFGRLAGAVERRLWRPQRLAGVVHVVALATPLISAAVMLDRRLRHRSMLRVGYVAALTWSVLGATSLQREARGLRAVLAAGDVAGARSRLPNLCGRDPELLESPGLIRAAIESVAENTSDAAVAPLVWGALAGPAGLVGYRAINTLDAMVGHRSDRYRSFGWAAARLDDVANLVPARLTAVLATVLAPLVGGRRQDAWRVWRRDASSHPSPNAGPCEAAFAGALDVRLGGPIVYSYGVSARAWLGDGREPQVADIDRAVTLSRLAVLTTAVCAVGLAYRRSR